MTPKITPMYITPDGKLTEAGRAKREMWRMGINKWERLQGHKPKLPKDKQNGGRRHGELTVREMIADTLKSGPKGSREISALIDKHINHTAAELSDMKRMGLVAREVRKVDGVKTPVWKLP